MSLDFRLYMKCNKFENVIKKIHRPWQVDPVVVCTQETKCLSLGHYVEDIFYNIFNFSTQIPFIFIKAYVYFSTIKELSYYFVNIY